MRNPVVLLAFALIFAFSAARAGDADNAWCSTERITAVRQQVLSERNAAGHVKGAAARAAYETLKLAVDAGWLLATSNAAAPASAATLEAIAYAWLLHDASTPPCRGR